MKTLAAPFGNIVANSLGETDGGAPQPAEEEIVALASTERCGLIARRYGMLYSVVAEILVRRTGLSVRELSAGITRRRNEMLREALANADTYQEVAEQLGLKETTVQAMARQARIFPRLERVIPAQLKWAKPEIREAAYARWVECESIPVVATEFGLAPHVVRDIVDAKKKRRTPSSTRPPPPAEERPEPVVLRPFKDWKR